MFKNIFLPVYLKRFIKDKIKYTFVFLLFFAAIFTQKANAQDLVLQDTTITTTATFSANNSISAGPNFTISNTGDVSFEYGNSIHLNPGVVIIAGGQFRAISDINVGIESKEEPVVPTNFVVEQNYPNPFNPETTIQYQIPKRSEVKLVIFSLLGQRVATLVDEVQSIGIYSVQWDGKDDTGKEVASGVYLYRLQTKQFVQVKKLALLR